MIDNYEILPKALIDLKAFRNNIDIASGKFPTAKIILPVKANAYGHGDILISKEAQNIGIDYLAVARVFEGLKLRENGIKLPIINLGVEILDSNIKYAVLNNIELTINCIEEAKRIEQVLKDSNYKLSVHLKIDTGMTRLGSPYLESLELARYINSSKFLVFKSAYTHFAKSEENNDFTLKQLDLFFNFAKNLQKENIEPEFYHTHNSAAVLSSFPVLENKKIAIRPGIMSYGYSPFPTTEDFGLIPVMNLVTKIVNKRTVPQNTGVSYNHRFVTQKQTFLGTIPAGYGDGIPRSLSNKFQVKINGKNYYQRGTITMDLIVIEIDENVSVGDDVFIFGNKNYSINTAKDLAHIANTISYEITTCISQRVERVVMNG